MLVPTRIPSLIACQGHHPDFVRNHRIGPLVMDNYQFIYHQTDRDAQSQTTNTELFSVLVDEATN